MSSTVPSWTLAAYLRTSGLPLATLRIALIGAWPVLRAEAISAAVGRPVVVPSAYLSPDPTAEPIVMVISSERTAAWVDWVEARLATAENPTAVRNAARQW